MATTPGCTIEVIPSRLTYTSVPPRRAPGGGGALLPAPLPPDTPTAVYCALEEFCVYHPFFLDFGPCPLNHLYRFCRRLNELLAGARHVHLVSSTAVQRRANAVYLIAAHSLLYRGLSPAQALAPFRAMSPPLPPWHDASPQEDPFHLTTLDVLRGVERARACGLFSFATFDLEDYETYEAPENGDMNWLAEGRFLALAGPVDSASPAEEGYCMTTTEQLRPKLRHFGVTALVRLNRKYYNERRVVAAGVAHVDLYFEDGSNPPEAILQKFLRFCEATPGAIGVRECVVCVCVCVY
jgi:cell division cycle 14